MRPLSSPKSKDSNNEVLHRKRVAQILRYIATMQTNQSSQFSFLTSEPKGPFCSLTEETDDGGGQVLFTWYDFQRLATVVQRDDPGKTLPFSFYQASKKSGKTGDASCWLRLTRWTSSDVPAPPTLSPAILQFLQTWFHDDQFARLEALETPAQLRILESRLSSQRLAQITPAGTPPKVQRWWRRYVHYRAALKLQRQLEPLYNHLFEWFHHQQDSDELIWGLGQAQWHRNGTFLDGPLLEVRVEVELARDGALLVRPKEHAGVSLNRQVMAAITSGEQDESLSTKQLRQLVEGYGASDLSPGEPSTYTRLLKQMAVEWSSGGTFCRATNLKNQQRPSSLVVTDAWCLYSSPRPSAVWARDAYVFAEKLGKSDPVVLPQALKSLTLGPSSLDETLVSSPGASNAMLGWLQSILQQPRSDAAPATIMTRPAFPLPTSDAQNRIADLLLNRNYPAVVCEGPPGTGKTHTIANIVCAYLCQGKRVLVTSKGAPALSVLRERLPECVQELCVDVSKSESSGMRQLQQTVERLANKVAWVNSEREFNKSQALEQTIQDLESELQSIDERLGANAKEKRELVQMQQGQDLFEAALDLMEQAPWLMHSVATWDASQVSTLHRKMHALVFPSDDPMLMVHGFSSPPSDALISLAACKAGHALSYLTTATKGMLARIPLLGNRMAQHNNETQAHLDMIRVNGVQPGPDDKKDWYLVFERLRREKAIHSFCQERLEPLFTRESWPRDIVLESSNDMAHIRAAVIPLLEKAAAMKRIAEDLGLTSRLGEAVEMERLDKRRAGISARIQAVAEDLVAARVVAELSKNFSADAQSALVKFAQVSGKAQFGKSSQASKMTQRQRRKRQEYLDAFEKCVRYIPCWILTSSQISDYLPSECLFDLVVIDEASQSDVTVLPGMLRGRQWLIVGDGKQVSPTESFVAEEQIEMLKAAMPESPFEASMLPGHSFFDLCAQAFPKGRVILREHFRCAPEIISYSNQEFYNSNLVPLRLPTSKERLSPSLMDVRVPNGQKVGKINEQECDVIVDMIGQYVESCTLLQKRSIGVISLVGDEQSRLIRGRLLDRIGPHKYKLHNILVGEPPSFQGAERDIVFLSMVCSPRAIVTQSQLMHAQRINVALSRARDRMVLVRSIDSNHIPNEQDVKFSVLDFFERSKHATRNQLNQDEKDEDKTYERLKSYASPFRLRAERLLVKLLEVQGYSTLSMGVVWDNAICVENAGGSFSDSGRRAAVCIEAMGESQDEWMSMLEQQKSIERVGWNCLRVDAVSFLSNHARTLGSIKIFLSSVMVFPKDMRSKDTKVGEENVALPNLEAGVVEAAMDDLIGSDIEEEEFEEVADDEEVVVISSDDDMEDEDRKPAASTTAKGEDNDYLDRLGDGETADDYGDVADLGFLGASERKLRLDDDSDEDSDIRSTALVPPPVTSNPSVPTAGRRARSNKRKEPVIDVDEDSELEGKQSPVTERSKISFFKDDLSETSDTIAASSPALRRKRQRVGRNSRESRSYHDRTRADDDLSDAEGHEEGRPAHLHAGLELDDQKAWEMEQEQEAVGSDDESYRDENDEERDVF